MKNVLMMAAKNLIDSTSCLNSNTYNVSADRLDALLKLILGECKEVKKLDELRISMRIHEERSMYESKTLEDWKNGLLEN